MKTQLFLVATPIGNMQDITLRALETLKTVDIIACEDTRHTLGLLNYHNIKKPLVSYYQHKEKEGTQQIMELLESGKTVALVSDAGMPLISDPGSVLVKELQKQNISYTVIPGANAAVSAACLAGIDGPFAFLGFLPEKNKDFNILIDQFKNTNCSLIIYSAPHDVNKNLDKLYQGLGDRHIYLVREMTKLYEQVISGELSILREEKPRGEYVIIIENKGYEKTEYTDLDIEKLLKKELLNSKDKKEAVKNVSENYGIAKNRVYKICVDL